MVTLKASHIVKPADQTPNEIMYVSEFDQMRSKYPIPTIYFYRPSSEKLRDIDPIKILKDSLSKALVFFYPFAGRLHSTGGGRVELHCNSKGVVLVEAESESKIDDFGEFWPTKEMCSLVPAVNYSTTPLEEIPVLRVQLTKFSCGGLSLGLAMSHTIVDGHSGLHFVTEWSKIALSNGSISDVDRPFLDRTILKPREPALPTLPLPLLVKSALSRPPLLLRHSDDLEERKKATTTTVLKLNKEQIQKLKDEADQKPLVLENNSTENLRGFSRYETISAHIWRCATKARGHASEQPTAIYVVVDFRNKLRQQLPPRYFGNAIIRIPAIATAGELLTKPLGYASGKIRETVNMVTDEFVSSCLVSMKNLLDVTHFWIAHDGSSQGSFYGNPNISVTSWLGLPLYGADFGWDSEVFMGRAALGYDGKAFIIPSHIGDGSISVPFCLQAEYMDDFEKYFYGDI